MRLAILTLTLLLLAGCDLIGPPTPPVERGADELWARYLAWMEGLGQDLEDAPQVRWWYSSCPDHPEDPRTFVVVLGVCYHGLADRSGQFVRVAWRGSFSRSAYVHELIHAWQGQRGIVEDVDPETGTAKHERPEWQLEDPIRDRLREEGL